jgi:UDP-N-acetylmuramoyl-L-alanyl-D-glutamate--2,6-diaminopimelate ligase
VVLIAGKGHEAYQILKDRTIDFDDRMVAAEAIHRLK